MSRLNFIAGLFGREAQNGSLACGRRVLAGPGCFRRPAGRASASRSKWKQFERREAYERTSASQPHIPLPTGVSVGARMEPFAGPEPDTIIPDRIQVGRGRRAEKDAAPQRLQTCLDAPRSRT